MLIGGAGPDVFVIGGGVDEIRDFEPGIDYIQVGLGFHRVADVLAHVADGPNGAVLDLPNFSTTTFTGIAAASLHASDVFIL